MANLSDLIPLVRERVHNCPDPVIEDALKWAARDFSRFTHVWTSNSTLTLTAGTNTASITQPAGTDILAWRMLMIDEDGQPIVILDRPEWKRVRSDSLPRFAHISPINTLSFDATPESDTVIRYEIALMPDSGSIGVDDQLVNQWGDVVAAGAKYRLMTQPDRFWADVNAAQIELMEYREGMMQAKSLKMYGQANTPKKVHQNRFI
jgi:hypothetical protein